MLSALYSVKPRRLASNSALSLHGKCVLGPQGTICRPVTSSSSAIPIFPVSNSAVLQELSRSRQAVKTLHSPFQLPYSSYARRRDSALRSTQIALSRSFHSTPTMVCFDALEVLQVLRSTRTSARSMVQFYRECQLLSYILYRVQLREQRAMLLEKFR